MASHEIIRILLRGFESALVIAIMVFTAVIAGLLSSKTELEGPVYRVWVVDEIFGAVILELNLVETIFASAYDLQPYGFLVFQALKLLLWTIVTFTSIGVVISNAGHAYDEMIAPLVMIWILFVIALVYAYTYYIKARTRQSDGETAPLLAESP